MVSVSIMVGVIGVVGVKERRVRSHVGAPFFGQMVSDKARPRADRTTCREYNIHETSR
jgi:hypothetical protein